MAGTAARCQGYTSVGGCCTINSGQCQPHRPLEEGMVPRANSPLALGTININAEKTGKVPPHEGGLPGAPTLSAPGYQRSSEVV